jgi:hypothetical protein
MMLAHNKINIIATNWQRTALLPKFCHFDCRICVLQSLNEPKSPPRYINNCSNI